MPVDLKRFLHKTMTCNYSKTEAGEKVQLLYVGEKFYKNNQVTTASEMLVNAYMAYEHVFEKPTETYGVVYDKYSRKDQISEVRFMSAYCAQELPIAKLSLALTLIDSDNPQDQRDACELLAESTVPREQYKPADLAIIDKEGGSEWLNSQIKAAKNLLDAMDIHKHSAAMNNLPNTDSASMLAFAFLYKNLFSSALPNLLFIAMKGKKISDPLLARKVNAEQLSLLSAMNTQVGLVRDEDSQTQLRTSHCLAKWIELWFYLLRKQNKMTTDQKNRRDAFVELLLTDKNIDDAFISTLGDRYSLKCPATWMSTFVSQGVYDAIIELNNAKKLYTDAAFKHARNIMLHYFQVELGIQNSTAHRMLPDVLNKLQEVIISRSTVNSNVISDNNYGL